MDHKLEKILNHFGKDNQELKLLEEVKELKLALEWNDRDQIEEEMADVLVVINQLKTERVENIYRKKINRTLKRMEEGYYDN